VATSTSDSGQLQLSYAGLASGTALLTVTAFNAVPYVTELTVQGDGPAVGRLVLSEVMADPACVPDSAGEWLELYNPTAADVSLEGFTLSDAGTDHLVLPELTIEAGGLVVLCRNSDPSLNGNIPCTAVYTGLSLANAGDELILAERDGNVVDQLVFGGSTGVAVPRGASLARHEGATPLWSAATVAIIGGCGDRGSPGSANF